MDNLIGQLRSAIAWRVLCELYRRHDRPGRHLAVQLLHPCGGQATMLCLMLQNDIPASPDAFVHESLLHMSLSGGGVHLCAAQSGPELIIEDFVGMVLREGMSSLLDRLGRALNLPAPPKLLPATTPQSLCYRVMTRIAERHALDRSGVLFQCGYVDTAGDGSGIHPHLQLFSSLHSIFPTGVSTVRVQMGLAHWIIARTKNALTADEPLGVLTTDVQLHLLSGQVVDCWGRFNELNRDVDRLSWWIEGQLGMH
ncbi:MAG: hypothetical protein EA401_08085 [Planctomycetota bacterium]|nr:MAG: hypothetical protein EA401_08085 [Planctomycetota bacterium]